MSAITTGSPAKGFGVLRSQAPPATSAATTQKAARLNRLGRLAQSRSPRLRFLNGWRSSSRCMVRPATS